jgi:Cu-processing system permease protein
LLAILVGCGSTALIIALTSDNTAQNWLAYGLMLASSWLLGGVFIALGYFISAVVRERATAVGAAVGLWLWMVVLYDLALLGALLADGEQQISPQLLATLLVANPTDAYRVFNLLATEGVSQIAGLADIAADAGVGQAVPLLVLGAWILAGLGTTIVMLYRREL